MTADTKELVERLFDYASQLRKCVKLAAFGGEATGVRVKSPELLLEDIEEAIARITALEAMERRAETAEAETRRVRKSWSDFADNIRQRELESAEAQVTALKAEVGRLWEALEPFFAASEAHKTAVDRYNTRLVVVREERERGDWNGNMDAYSKAVDEAARKFHEEASALRDRRAALQEKRT